LANAETGVSVSSRQSFQIGTSVAFAARFLKSSRLTGGRALSPPAIAPAQPAT